MAIQNGDSIMKEELSRSKRTEISAFGQPRNESDENTLNVSKENTLNVSKDTLNGTKSLLQTVKENSYKPEKPQQKPFLEKLNNFRNVFNKNQAILNSQKKHKLNKFYPPLNLRGLSLMGKNHPLKRKNMLLSIGSKSHRRQRSTPSLRITPMISKATSRKNSQIIQCSNPESKNNSKRSSIIKSSNNSTQALPQGAQ